MQWMLGAMRRIDLLRMISRAARDKNLPWEAVREGGSHEVWRLGNLIVIVPRHREIGDKTTQRILQTVEALLGKDWWRR